jgi:predicted membrane channel-forming protein YqfA (hemolysin III family)
MNTKRFLVWSNLLFVIPLVISVYFQMWGMVCIIAGTLASSIAYHTFGGDRNLMIDRVFGILLIFADGILVFLGHFVFPYFLLAIFFGGIALSFYMRKEFIRFNLHHGMWHICVSLGTICCLLTYRFGAV